MEILYKNHCGDIGNTVKTVSLVTKNIKISCQLTFSLFCSAVFRGYNRKNIEIGKRKKQVGTLGEHTLNMIAQIFSKIKSLFYVHKLSGIFEG